MSGTDIADSRDSSVTSRGCRREIDVTKVEGIGIGASLATEPADDDNGMSGTTRKSGLV
jgi:hypothetical protein